MDLHVAVVREYRGDGVLVPLIDGRDGLIELRFRHARDAKLQRADRQRRHNALQARQALAGEHRFQFMRRTGQDHQHAAAFFDPLARRGAAIVRQNVRALDHHRLTPVDFGHRRDSWCESAARCLR